MPRIPICKECLPGGICHPFGCPICGKKSYHSCCKADEDYCVISHPELNDKKVR
ncbi:MAG: hypothetical protein ACTSVR_04845 [Candidatus Thorarchaeota archaeon]